MKAETQKLADAVRSELRSQGVKQNTFALEQLLDYRDFRVQLNRNSFSPYVIKAVAKLLTNGSVTELEERFEFKEIIKRKNEVLSPLEAFRQKVDTVIRPDRHPELLDILETLYLDMGKQSNDGNRDIVVTCSFNELPVECTDEGWSHLQHSYVQALNNGSTFLYVLPSQEALSRVPRRMLHQFFTGSAPEEQMKDLRNEAEKAGADPTMTAQNIVLLTPDIFPFWTIDMQFIYCSILAQNRTDKDEVLLSTILYGGVHGKKVRSSKLPLVMASKIMHAFHASLDNCFEQEERLLPLFRKIATVVGSPSRF